MSATHSIRLNGPWQFQTSRTAFFALDENSDVADEGRIKLPVDWTAFLVQHHAGHFRFSRSFNFPAELAVDEIVQLCFESLSENSYLWLNGHALHPQSQEDASCAEVQTLVRPVNRLVLNWTSLNWTRLNCSGLNAAESDPVEVPFHAATLQIRSGK